MNIALHWFRADLRLGDNTALHAASQWADVVVPVFIFDPRILRAPDTGAPIVGFMLECLESLSRDVAMAKGQLIFRHGDPVKEMRALLQATEAKALYFNRDYEPQSRERDAAVTKMAQSLGVEVHSYKDAVVHEPDEVLKPDGEPYRVFTAYARVWRTKARPRVWPKVGFDWPRGFKPPRSFALPTAEKLGHRVEISLPPAGEGVARERLGRFVRRELLHYEARRDFPALHATSGLSPHLRLGTLSPRTVLAAVHRAAAKHPDARQHVQTFEGELIWREFYRQILWHFPHVATSAYRKEYAALKWENDPRLFRAWCEGRTGFPIVDAGMRQLNTTGWMHNRVRMIVAAFLTKDLLVSWQCGERYFMQKLLDADLANNNGGWQWSAGTGTDAQPYFRIFNPVAQARKFDPGGVYIHKYVPEAETKKYPAPIIDHSVQRLKALALFRR